MNTNQTFLAAQAHARQALKKNHDGQWRLAAEFLKVAYGKRQPLTIAETIQIVTS